MFLTVCLHILVEVIYHQWNCVELASRMTHELKILFLAQASTVFLYTCYLHDGAHLARMAVTVRLILFSTSLLYIFWGLKRANDGIKSSGLTFWSPQLEFNPKAEER